MVILFPNASTTCCGPTATDIGHPMAENDQGPWPYLEGQGVGFSTAAQRIDAEFAATERSDWTRAVDEARWLYVQDPAKPTPGLARRAAAFALASAKLEVSRPEAVGDMLIFDNGVSIQFAAMTHLIDARLDTANRPAPSTPVLAA